MKKERQKFTSLEISKNFNFYTDSPKYSQIRPKHKYIWVSKKISKTKKELKFRIQKDKGIYYLSKIYYPAYRKLDFVEWWFVNKKIVGKFPNTDDPDKLAQLCLENIKCFQKQIPYTYWSPDEINSFENWKVI